MSNSLFIVCRSILFTLLFHESFGVIMTFDNRSSRMFQSSVHHSFSFYNGNVVENGRPLFYRPNLDMDLSDSDEISLAIIENAGNWRVCFSHGPSIDLGLNNCEPIWGAHSPSIVWYDKPFTSPTRDPWIIHYWFEPIDISIVSSSIIDIAKMPKQSAPIFDFHDESNFNLNNDGSFDISLPLPPHVDMSVSMFTAHINQMESSFHDIRSEIKNIYDNSIHKHVYEDIEPNILDHVISHLNSIPYCHDGSSMIDPIEKFDRIVTNEERKLVKVLILGDASSFYYGSAISSQYRSDSQEINNPYASSNYQVCDITHEVNTDKVLDNISKMRKYSECLEFYKSEDLSYLAFAADYLPVSSSNVNDRIKASIYEFFTFIDQVVIEKHGYDIHQVIVRGIQQPCTPSDVPPFAIMKYNALLKKQCMSRGCIYVDINEDFYDYSTQKVYSSFLTDESHCNPQSVLYLWHQAIRRATDSKWCSPQIDNFISNKARLSERRSERQITKFADIDVGEDIYLYGVGMNNASIWKLRYDMEINLNQNMVVAIQESVECWQVCVFAEIVPTEGSIEDYIEERGQVEDYRLCSPIIQPEVRDIPIKSFKKKSNNEEKTQYNAIKFTIELSFMSNHGQCFLMLENSKLESSNTSWKDEIWIDNVQKSNTLIVAPEVSSPLIGGLGSQLFNIFATISYALDHGLTFHFISEHSKHDYQDTFLINLKHYIQNESKHSRNTMEVNKRVILVSKQGFQDENIHYPMPPPPSITSQFEIIWNNPHQFLHFKHNALFISREYIKYPLHRENALQKLKMEFDFNKESDIFISIHFRMGDYKIPSMIYEILTSQYYTDSIDFMINTLSNKRKTQTKNTTMIKLRLSFLLFFQQEDYNTIMKLKEEFESKFIVDGGIDISFKLIPTNLDDWVSFLLMTSCDHHIIANSSFSWFAAYLHFIEEEAIKSENFFLTNERGREDDDLDYGSTLPLVTFPSRYFLLKFGSPFPRDQAYPKEWKMIKIS